MNLNFMNKWINKRIVVIFHKKEMRIALFQPDIPQNTGNILRLAACLDIEVDIIYNYCFL